MGLGKVASVAINLVGNSASAVAAMSVTGAALEGLSVKAAVVAGTMKAAAVVAATATAGGLSGMVKGATSAMAATAASASAFLKKSLVGMTAAIKTAVEASLAAFAANPWAAVATAVLAVAAASAVMLAKGDEINKMNLKTAGILKTTGQSYDDNKDAIDDNIASIVKLSGVEEVIVKEVFNKIMAGNGDLETSYKLTDIAINGAVQTGEDWITIAEMVRNAANGDTAALEEYGFAIDETATKEERGAQIQEQAAAIWADSGAAAETISGSIGKLGAAMSSAGSMMSDILGPSLINTIHNLQIFMEKSILVKAVLGILVGSLYIVVNVLEVVSAAMAVNALGINTLYLQLRKLIAIMKGDTEAADKWTKKLQENDEELKNTAISLFKAKEAVAGYTDAEQEAAQASIEAQKAKDAAALAVDGLAASEEALNTQLQAEEDHLKSLAEQYNDSSIEKKRALYHQSLGRYTTTTGSTEGSDIESREIIQNIGSELATKSVTLMEQQEDATTKFLAIIAENTKNNNRSASVAGAAQGV